MNLLPLCVRIARPHAGRRRGRSITATDGLRGSGGCFGGATPEVVARLRSGLAAEGHALTDLRSARHQVRTALLEARAQGATYRGLVCLLVPATGDAALTYRRRERMAANLRGRVYEARRTK